METGRAGVSPQPPQGWRMEVKVRHSAASSSSWSRAAQAHSQRPASKQGRLPHPFPSQPCACPLSRAPALSSALCSPVACKTWGVGGGMLGAGRCWGVSAESLAPRSVGVRIRWVHLASGYLRCQLLTSLQKAARVTGRRSLKPIGSSSLILFSSSPRPHPDRSTAVPWGPSGQTRLCHPFSLEMPENTDDGTVQTGGNDRGKARARAGLKRGVPACALVRLMRAQAPGAARTRPRPHRAPEARPSRPGPPLNPAPLSPPGRLLPPNTSWAVCAAAHFLQETACPPLG